MTVRGIGNYTRHIINHHREIKKRIVEKCLDEVGLYNLWLMNSVNSNKWVNNTSIGFFWSPRL